VAASRLRSTGRDTVGSNAREVGCMAAHQRPQGTAPRIASTLVCAGCGAVPDPAEPYPFRCPNAGTGDIDHVLTRVLDRERVVFPDGPAAGNPFVTYRGLLHSCHRAMAGGLSDGEYVALVDALDHAVAGVDGHGFTATPFERSDALSRRLGFSGHGGVWVKDETGNVAGSHKGRHLMGVMLHLEVASRLCVATDVRPDLAIASCGNAALAAAVVARAGGWALRVFVPVDADPSVMQRLRQLDADVVVCTRRPGEAGDPCYLRLQEALAGGALPFTCQGSDNGLVIEGGETLGYELVAQARAVGIGLEHLVVQVGGGALASACAQALREAHDLGAMATRPALHTVQTAGVHPLERAYRLVAGEIGEARGSVTADEAVRRAARHRSAYMWPWESPAASVATGILDDETYDWQAVVIGMLETCGQACVASEQRLLEANGIAVSAGFDVDPTGSAGLAGLLDLRDAGSVTPDERVAVLFTGVRRAPGRAG
jgi:threonine synthase